MNEKELSIVEYQEQRVVTTKQIAEVYGASEKTVRQNFKRNIDKFIEGKHYYLLKDDELKDFKSNNTTNCGAVVSSRAKNLYLWTERGALLLAKSINTDTAWEAYERLVDFYFEKKEQVANSSTELLALANVVTTLANTVSELAKTVSSIDERLRKLENQSKSESEPLECPELSWYERNKDTIFYVANDRNISAKQVVSMMLGRLGDIYDLTKAKQIYREKTGKNPLYDLDVVDFFPNLKKDATVLINLMVCHL